MTSQSTKTVSKRSYIYLTGYYTDSSSNRKTCDLYFYEIDSKHVLGFIIEPSKALNADELNTFLNITIY